MILGLLAAAMAVGALAVARASGEVATATACRLAYEAGRLERSEEHAQLRDVWKEQAARVRRVEAQRAADAAAHARQLAAARAALVKATTAPTAPFSPDRVRDEVLPKLEERAPRPAPATSHLPDRGLELLAAHGCEDE